LKIILILISISMIGHVFAEHPLGTPAMAKRMFQAQMKVVKAPLCHSSSDVSLTKNTKSKVNTDYFNAKVSCTYKCKSSEDVNKETIESKFEPRLLSLYEGDGSSTDKVLWRSLAVTIVTWSKDLCLKAALKKCRKIENINSFNFDKIQSGDWEFDGVLNCQREDTVYSPFEEKFNLDNSGKRLYQPFQTNSNPDTSNLTPSFPAPSKNKLSEFITEYDSKTALISQINKPDCVKSVKVDACFGDCVWETDNKNNLWSETISTNKPLGTDSMSICMDTLKNKFEFKGLSQEVKQFQCEKFVWEFMRKTESMGSSCASMRTKVDCSSLL
jgi:hypothetical protein